jgi:hypothetical protein
MNIIFGEAVKHVPDRYTVLELDTFYIPEVDQHVQTWAVIEKIPLNEFTTVAAYKTVHEDLIQFYRQRHWTYCEHAIEKLTGRWNGELDTFYEDLYKRVKEYQQCEPDATWTGAILKHAGMPDQSSVETHQ